MGKQSLAAVWIAAALSSLIALLFNPPAARANSAGGGDGKGPNVTVADNGDGTVTLTNGIVSIVIVTKTSRLNSVTYTYSDGAGKHTSQMLLGKGQYYYGGFMLGNGSYTYSLATDPTTNGGDYADVKLLSDSPTNGAMETHFSMLRGSPGYYSTAIMTHRKQDAAFEVGAWGVVTRVPPSFNWLSADARRNFFIGAPGSRGVMIPNAPHEITVNLNGARQGEFADKFIYGQDHADLKAWGWSSVGKGGLNVGVWMMTTMEFSDGGPLKRDVSVYPYSELNNSILTGELGMGSDGHLAAGEVWTKTCGPWFIYMNHVAPTITGAKDAAKALYGDALAQAQAEKKAWPYSWFKNPHYAPPAGRGVVRGRIVIHDSANPNASAAGIWVGIEQQPHTIKGIYDFQKWLKAYQFWVQTDADGTFTIPNVLPGTNYTLWAYGPGAAGTFLSQHQTGGDPPLEYTLPEKSFAVTVKAGETTNLGTVTWTPTRVGPTVFELGYPDRKAGEFRHGEDYWSPDPSPKLGYPTPIWGGQMKFPLDFPKGMTYTVGSSRWTTDWNYVLPSLPDPAGVYQPCAGTIVFNLAKPPDPDAAASIYLGCAGDDGGHIVVDVNGADLAAAANVSAQPNPFNAKDVDSRNHGVGGFNPPYSDDSSIHFSDHGPFSDERLTFPAAMLHAGRNTITITMNARSLTAYLMVDYLRLELTGYVPPPPQTVYAYPGNNRVLVCWPLVPGATRYTVLRSTDPATGYAPIATCNNPPACGSGPARMTYTDAAVINGRQYYYAVQSANSQGHSDASIHSPAAAPAAQHPMNVPAAPEGVKVVQCSHHYVELRWNASPGADYYSVWRTTLYPNGVGADYPLRTILLDDATTKTRFTDRSPTDGTIYSYHVEAISAAGASAPSDSAKARPLPPPPAAAPGSLAGAWSNSRHGPTITLHWSPVPGAAGYVIYRTSRSDGQFHWPQDFVTTLTETTYTDKNSDKKKAKKADKPLVDGAVYWYQVTAVNTAGVSPSAVVEVSAR